MGFRWQIFAVLWCMTISTWLVNIFIHCEVYLFALFYFHHFLIECTSEGWKMHFRGTNLKNFLREPMYLHVMCEILSVTPASKLNDNPAPLPICWTFSCWLKLQSRKLLRIENTGENSSSTDRKSTQIQPIRLKPLNTQTGLNRPDIYFTLSNARRFYSSMGNPRESMG